MSQALPVTVVLSGEQCAHIRRATLFRPDTSGMNWAAPCIVAEKLTAMEALAKVPAEGGEVTLDAFTWDCINSELCRLFIADGRKDHDVLMTFWAIYKALHANPQYAAVHKKALVYERRKRKIERMRKRHEKEKRILAAYAHTGNPNTALGIYNG